MEVYQKGLAFVETEVLTVIRELQGNDFFHKCRANTVLSVDGSRGKYTLSDLLGTTDC